MTNTQQKNMFALLSLVESLDPKARLITYSSSLIKIESSYSFEDEEFHLIDEAIHEFIVVEGIQTPIHHIESRI